MVDINRVTSESVVDLIFHLKWKSSNAIHTDGYQASQVNIWRDILPPKLLDALLDRELGERLQMPIKDGDGVEAFKDKNLLRIKSTQFDRRFNPNEIIEPHAGRFYPKGMLTGIDGVFRANIQPFRCVGLNNGHMTVDLNHPLAGKDLTLSVVIGKIGNKRAERGGTSIDWLETLTSGPGMQARWQDQQTDYFYDGVFERDDEHPDIKFYRNPRLVHHIPDAEVVLRVISRLVVAAEQEEETPAHVVLPRLIAERR